MNRRGEPVGVNPGQTRQLGVNSAGQGPCSPTMDNSGFDATCPDTARNVFPQQFGEVARLETMEVQFGGIPRRGRFRAVGPVEPSRPPAHGRAAVKPRNARVRRAPTR